MDLVCPCCDYTRNYAEAADQCPACGVKARPVHVPLPFSVGDLAGFQPEVVAPTEAQVDVPAPPSAPSSPARFDAPASPSSPVSPSVAVLMYASVHSPSYAWRPHAQGTPKQCRRRIADAGVNTDAQSIKKRPPKKALSKPRVMGHRAGHLRPMRECPELTRQSTETRVYKTQMRIAGTVPRLVCMDAHRLSLVHAIVDRHGDSFAEGGREATPAEFQKLLLEAGYSEGSLDKVTHKNRKDGNVYKYPGYMSEFFTARVFEKRCDFFAPNARKAAWQCASRLGTAKARASPKYAGLTVEQRGALERKLTNTLMHGFDDYVQLATR